MTVEARVRVRKYLKIFLTIIASVILIFAAVLIFIRITSPEYFRFECSECHEHTFVRDRLVDGMDLYLCDDCYLSMTE